MQHHIERAFGELNVSEFCRMDGRHHLAVRIEWGFTLSGLLISGFFVMGTGMHERYILPAIMLLLLGAAFSDSRRQFAAASLFSISAIFNIYFVYVYKSYVADAGITIPVSILCIAAFLYTLYAIL